MTTHNARPYSPPERRSGSGVHFAKTIEVELPEEAVRRLQAEAGKRGVSIEQLVAELASELPGEGSGPGRRPAFVGVGASESGTTDRIEEILAEGFGRD